MVEAEGVPAADRTSGGEKRIHGNQDDRRDRAAELGITSLTELGPLAKSLTIAGGPEFFGRPEWTRVREIYGLQDIRTRWMDSTFMYGAVRDGEVARSLEPLINAISNPLMRSANRDVDVDGVSIEVAARKLRNSITQADQ